MAAFKTTYHFTLRDVDGNSSTSSLSNDALPDVTTLAAAKAVSDAINGVLAPITNAKVVRRSLTVIFDEAQGVGADAEFPLVSQKAVLHFSNAAGSNASFSIPAPKEADFRAPPSDDIIDPTNGAVAAFIAEYEGDAKDAGANLLNLFQGGALSSRRRSRRRSIHS
jgi:hypothetical protein